VCNIAVQPCIPRKRLTDRPPAFGPVAKGRKTEINPDELNKPAIAAARFG
jgi:hypothetical protein